jgi:hypothetical protein
MDRILQGVNPGLTDQTQSVGVDQSVLKENFKAVLLTSLRGTSRLLVIRANDMDDEITKFILHAYNSGHSVLMALSLQDAPADTVWLNAPVL